MPLGRRFRSERSVKLQKCGGAEGVFCGPPDDLRVLNVPRSMGGESVMKLEVFEIVTSIEGETTDG